jgi:hypothetical protein
MPEMIQPGTEPKMTTAPAERTRVPWEPGITIDQAIARLQQLREQSSWAGETQLLLDGEEPVGGMSLDEWDGAPFVAVENIWETR